MADNGKTLRTLCKYEILLCWSDEDRAFVTEEPDLPGCMAHGDDQETALRHIEDTMQFRIERAQELGRPVPEPKGERLVFSSAPGAASRPRDLSA